METIDKKEEWERKRLLDVELFKKDMKARQEKVRADLMNGDIEPKCMVCDNNVPPPRLSFPSEFTDNLVCNWCKNLPILTCQCGKIFLDSRELEKHQESCESISQCEKCGNIIYQAVRWFGYRKFCSECPSQELSYITRKAELVSAQKFIDEMRYHIRRG